MTRLISSGATLILSSFLLVGCSNYDRADVGMVGGGVIGGIAGSALTGGSAAGTIVGAVGGGLIGRAVANDTYNDDAYYY